MSVFGAKGTGPPAFIAGVAAPAGKWVMPLSEDRYRVGCSMTCYAGHTGQDFPAHSGTPFYSSNNGTVVRSVALRNRSGGYRSYGNLIVIRAAGHPSTEMFYAHLQKRLVRAGDTVRADQVIGLSGYTGHVLPRGERGAHLHYEIPPDLMPILRSNGVTP